ncbi:hypothetical protein HXX76_003384 [Chlamydomonas incerta]|uniref:Uncharacterized protein n=1 Tax=Chlamydomonas incerta TaxID=51695 RepID=A0A835TMX9_CHLIN|nr:hypothetical protein HXX76_003384 [Chlamydomonas incerta]|eukprot:KAG2441771.1 hypothetical protein HXX76_003384 [Chlamydomonas incerta]
MPDLPTLQEADEEMRESSPERLSCSSQSASGPLFFSDMPAASFLESASGAEVSGGAVHQKSSAPAPAFKLDACPSFAEQRGRALFLERHATLQRAVFDSVEEGDEEDDGVPLPSRHELKLGGSSSCPYLPGWDMPGSDIWAMAGDALKTMDAEAAKVHFEPPAGFSPFGLSRCKTIARSAPLGLGHLALDITTAEPGCKQQQHVAFAAGLAAATTAGAAVSTAGGILAAAASAGVAAGPQAAISAGANMLLNRIQSMAVRRATSAAADSILGPSASASSANQLKQRLRACVCGASVMFFLVNVVSMQDSLSSMDFENDVGSSMKLVLDLVTSGPSVMENCRELLQMGVMTTLGVGQRAGGIAGAGGFGGGANFDLSAGAGLLQGMLSATGNGGN